MKKVLIALDYNPTAQKVAETGFAIAQAMSAEVVLIHVITNILSYESTIYYPIMGFAGYANQGLLPDDMLTEFQRLSQVFLDKSKEHLGDASIETLVKEGDSADEILAAAKEIKASIIVMGSHSQKWLEHIVMGSVTEEVLRSTTIPLFVVPTKKHT